MRTLTAVNKADRRVHHGLQVNQPTLRSKVAQQSLSPPSVSEQVKLMYDNGYGYSKSRHSIHVPDDARVPLETMVQDVDLSAQGWEVSSKRGVPRTFDGWWLQAGVSLLRPVGGNGRGAVAAGPVHDAAPAPLTNMVHHVTPAVLSSADIAAGDVCNTSVPEGATSTFSQVG